MTRQEFITINSALLTSAGLTNEFFNEEESSETIIVLSWKLTTDFLIKLGRAKNGSEVLDTNKYGNLWMIIGTGTVVPKINPRLSSVKIFRFESEPFEFVELTENKLNRFLSKVRLNEENLVSINEQWKKPVRFELV